MKNEKKEVTKEKIKSFLAGTDPMERIVNLDYSYKNDFISVYYRDENDNKCVSEEPFYPFLWAKKNACEKLCHGDHSILIPLMKKSNIWVKELETTNKEGKVIDEIENDGYKFMFYSTAPMSYSKFLDFFKKAENPVYSNNKQENETKSFTYAPISKKNSKQYLCVTPQEQFMISTGKRFFKGYEDYDNLLRLIFDLETTGLNTKSDKIEQIGIRFNRPVKYKGKYLNFEKILTVTGETEEEKKESELNAIITFIKIIYTFQPDVITAHNGEDFDWNLIIDGCSERLGKSLEEISKEYFKNEGIRKDKKHTILKLGGEIEKYYKTIVPHTIVTDSLQAVRRAQALDSSMLKADLKYVTKYSKIVKENRVYIPGNKISEIWNDNTNKYAFNNKDGEWYIYNENYIQPEIKPDPLKNIDYFRKLIEEDSIKKALSGNTESNYSNDITPEYLYDKYIKSIEEENKNIIYKKGKDKNGFTLYTKNILLEGYEIVTGKYIAERYLLDDLWECDKVEHRYNTSNFLICKMLPVPFQKCCTMGTAGQWKSIMLAWSYENNLAIPPFGESKTFTGGLSRLIKVGFVDDVSKFDYNSLYPSIILTWGISDPKDLLESMLAFLEHVLTEREKYKKLKKIANNKATSIKTKIEKEENIKKEEKDKLISEMMQYKSEEAANDKKQLPLKIFGNSFFGSYGAPNVFPWGSIECAERTTCTGRQALRLMIYHFNKLGYKPIVGDTDGFNFQLPKNYDATNLMRQNILSSDSKIKIRYIDTQKEENFMVSELLNIDKPYEILTSNGWKIPKTVKKINF